MSRSRWACAALALMCGACYHQNVRTGLAPSATVIDKPWVSTWLWGLVQAQPVDVRQECPSGTALIETEQSFPNGLVAIVTLGIYTPQHVRVTCASRSATVPRGGTEVDLPAGATAAERFRLIDAAVQHTLDTDTPTLLRF